jgi:hypothetical protein
MVLAPLAKYGYLVVGFIETCILIAIVARFQRT